jgi:hypothetical protein
MLLISLKVRLIIYLKVFLALLFLSLLTISQFNFVAYGESADTYVFLTPPMYIGKEIGELFDVSVNISNVENLRSLEFTVAYNTSLLDIAQVFQGPFFPSPPKSYFEFEKNESFGFVKVNMSLADSETPKSGNGTLAWISFKVVQGPESCVSSPLDLKQTLLLNSALTPIVHDSVGAVYFWNSMQPDPPPEGQLLDLYTQKAGVGPNKPGGEFVTGQMVYLFSRVTYNNDPVQQKLVAFQVLNPIDETVTIRTAITDQDGLVIISFRIPNILSSNGIWMAISTVDIAEKVVLDIISFQVYFRIPVGGYTYPIEEYTTERPLTPYLALVAILTSVFVMIKSKTHKGLGRSGRACVIFTLMLLLLLVRFNVLFGTSKGSDVLITDFYSCDASGDPQNYFPKKTTAYFNVSVRNLTYDPKNISIYLSTRDELDVPIGSDQLSDTIPADASTYYIMSVFIPRWAFVGIATADASVSVDGSPIDSKSTNFYIRSEDLTPPVIHLLSPENTTYRTESVPLIFTVDERTSWMGYSLNNLQNVSITGNTTLTGLANGSYSITVYANDTSGNVGSSEKVYFTILIVHDVAVIDVQCSSAEVHVGQIVNITVLVQNEGIVTETFNTTAYYNETIIQTQTVTNLAPDTQTILTLSWNTTDVAPDTYIIKAIASTVEGETDTADNTKVDGTVKIVKPPKAHFTYSPDYPATNQTVTFDASLSTPDGGTITSYAWNFDDGNTTTVTNPIITHAYNLCGTYNVTLTITDSEGLNDTTWKNVPVYIHDIAVTNVTSSKTVVGQGYSLNIEVTVTNQGDCPEIFNATTYANTTIIDTLANITLTSGNSTTIALTWNTTGIAKGNYTIKAVADTVQGETETGDNTYTDDKVLVSVPGDVDGDRDVDIDDLLRLTDAFWGTPSTPNWNPNADIDNTQTVSLDELLILIDHFWEHW